MKIATWNINSIRVRAEHVEKWLLRASPDVLCLQELKAPAGEFPSEVFSRLGYTASLSAQKTYNGAAILSRVELTDAREGLGHLPPDHPLNAQKRVISAMAGKVRAISAYMPNGEAVGSEKYLFKLDFFREFRKYLDEFHSPSELLCVAGDFNVAPEDRDLYNPEERKGGILVSEEERAALKNILDFGLHDCFRLKNQESGSYTWWDYQGALFWKDLGMRLDFILATKPLADLMRGCEIDKSPRKWKKPSDHTVVVADFDL